MTGDAWTAEVAALIVEAFNCSSAEAIIEANRAEVNYMQGHTPTDVITLLRSYKDRP